jgi:hypothetical protein
MEENCPYCNTKVDINHDDGYGYEEGETYQQECSYCGKTFIYYTSISFYYELEKADCLNGSDHIFKPTVTVPKCFTKMRCTMCDKERLLTEEEKNLHKIPSEEEYFKS